MDELLDEIESNYNREFLRMVNEQGVTSGKNNWDLVFRSFVFGKLAEFELRVMKLETLIKPTP
jgi:hypothetical protein